MTKGSTPFIPFLDGQLRRLAADPSLVGAVGAELRKNLDWAGHLLGDYMADLVIEVLGSDALKEDMGNPFSFFRVYSRAASEAGKPILSAEAMGALRVLESKYVARG